MANGDRDDWQAIAARVPSPRRQRRRVLGVALAVAGTSGCRAPEVLGPSETTSGTHHSGVENLSGEGPAGQLSAPAQRPGDAVQTALVCGGRNRDGRDVPDLRVMVDETTVEEFARCRDAGYCEGPDSSGPGCGSYKLSEQDDGHPITCVSQRMAESFCESFGMRLPSPEEWVWIAQNGALETRFPWGEEQPTDNHLHTGTRGRSDCRAELRPVGSFVRGQSFAGINDLQGNVTEWTSLRRGESAFRIGVSAGECYSDQSVDFGGEAFENGAGFGRPYVGFRCVGNARPAAAETCSEER